MIWKHNMWLAHSFMLPGESKVSGSLRKLETEDTASAWRTNGIIFLAVADGVGSRTRAASASKLAICLAEQHTLTQTQLLNDSAVEGRLAQFREICFNIQRDYCARIHGLTDSSEWKTTFTLVAIKSRTEVLFFSMGDSFIAIGHEGCSKFHLAYSQPTVSSDDNATLTLSHDFSNAKSTTVFIPSINAVFLSTDGLNTQLDFIETTNRFEVKGKAISQATDELRKENYGGIVNFFDHSCEIGRGDDLGVAMAAWS